MTKMLSHPATQGVHPCWLYGSLFTSTGLLLQAI